jgi:hypothetical protein
MTESPEALTRASLEADVRQSRSSTRRAAYAYSPVAVRSTRRAAYAYSPVAVRSTRAAMVFVPCRAIHHCGFGSRTRWTTRLAGNRRP